jgi:hypothetical protein
MPSTDSNLARKFAECAKRCLSSKQLSVKLRRAARQEEHKVVAEPMRKCLERFLKAQHSAPDSAGYDWEGNDRRKSKQKRSYKIFGTKAWPDAAVLGSFKCAFEFDREPDQGGDHFKRQLMKASVHVLSGAYDACVFVYTLTPGSDPRTYLDDKVHTTTLIDMLRDAGLYVCFIPKRAA